MDLKKTEKGLLVQGVSSIDEFISRLGAGNRPNKEIGGVELAVEVLGLTKQTIYKKVCLGEIPYMKRGGKLYFNRKKLEQWILEGENNDYRK